MKDPGPNLLEQIIKSNELLAAILAKPDGAPPSPGSPGAAGGINSQWPILFYWSNGAAHPFKVTGVGAGFACEVVSADQSQLSCDSAIKLTAAAGTGNWVQIAIDIPPPVSRAVRLQIAFAPFNAGAWATWHMRFMFYDHTQRYSAEIELSHLNGEVFYTNSAGNPVSLGINLFETLLDAWNKLDLVINFADRTYQWLAVNQNAFDLSTYELEHPGIAVTSKLTFELQLSNSHAEQIIYGHIDEILITDDLYTGPAE